MRLVVLGWAIATALIVLAYSSPTSGFKILMLSHFESKSMRKVFMALAQGLVSRGHDVTLIGTVPLQPGEDLGGVKVNIIPGPVEVVESFITNIYDIPKQGTSAYTSKLFNFALNLADDFLKTQISQELCDMPEGTYDMIIINALISDYIFPIIHKLARTKALLLTPEMLTWVADFHGIPYPYSYVPNTFAHLPNKMNFWQRVVNAWLSFEAVFAWNGCVLPALNYKVQRRFPGLPTIEEMQQRFSLFLVNSEPALTIAKPSLPYVVDVGAMHCRPAKRLEGEAASFVEQVGDEGFIVLSVGSMLKGSKLPPEVLRKLLNVFSRLEQKVIWKYEEENENFPSNVKAFKWLPQQDLLGHPKIRLLITHGGLLSLQEAVYHGIPVLGFSVFAEQPGNLARILERGIGKKFDLHDFTESSLFETIQELLTDSRYKEAASNYSVISRDQLQPPLDRAIYWVEYVIRHDGAPHLRTTADQLNFFQYFLLDIVVAILVGLGILSFVVVMLVKRLFKALARVGKCKTE